MTPFDTPTPELQVMSLGLYDLVTHAIAGAGLALLATFLFSWEPAFSDVTPAWLTGMPVACSVAAVLAGTEASRW